MIIILEKVIMFFNHPIFIIVGGLTVTLTAIRILCNQICRLLGVTPIIFRLGLALWKRKIAIFSSQPQFQSIKTTLIDSRVFTEKNIFHIESNNIEKGKIFTVFLIDWESCHTRVRDIFIARGDDQTPIIIYAKPEAIPKRTMTDIANRPNTVVVNFRGRLLNDILTSLITTTYDG